MKHIYKVTIEIVKKVEIYVSAADENEAGRVSYEAWEDMTGPDQREAEVEEAQGQILSIEMEAYGEG